MRDLAGGHSVAQGAHDGLLTRNLAECLGTVLPVEDFSSHISPNYITPRLVSRASSRDLISRSSVLGGVVVAEEVQQAVDEEKRHLAFDRMSRLLRLASRRRQRDDDLAQTRRRRPGGKTKSRAFSRRAKERTSVGASSPR